MHISEGVLSPAVLVAGGAVTFVGTGLGLKRIDYDHIMTVSLLTATFFVASLIHVPLGPGNIHLVLGGLMGLVLGWSAFPAILIALLLQAIFFQYGGLVVLGANTTVMALPAVGCYYLFRKWIETNGNKRKMAAFAAGFFSPLLSSLLMALALATSDQGFLQTAQLVVAAHIPLMIIEGVITMFIILFLSRVQPEFLSIGKS
ncbi:cobalt transporter CbiM [Desulforhopalus singaporensis]|uniref:Cobalt/nickel transport system permease protein n=1 Tax=Desulforhopalus singaporensis TaxID=91360 RepID=A0A1H0KSZ6_9BACT|nr:cobalt transporter CbiM [Desulforhopalus singaporensis]SDO58860.1 cobalt/nickel transport system permease protein [Desulforhopalus singaporensis]